MIETKPNDPRKRRVRLIETGEIFESARACAEELGVAHTSVLRCANHHTNRCKGYHIEFVD